MCLQHRPHGPHWHHHPTQGFPRHPPVNRAALLTFSVSAATAQQPLCSSLGSQQPLHQQPPLYREGPSPSASLPAPGTPAPAHSWSPAQTGAITQRPQRITSSPGLHHSPVQRKSKHSQKRKGDSECLFSHACTKSRERVCSRAQGPQRSPCPWDTSAVVSRAALVSPVGNG